MKKEDIENANRLIRAIAEMKEELKTWEKEVTRAYYLRGIVVHKWRSGGDYSEYKSIGSWIKDSTFEVFRQQAIYDIKESIQKFEQELERL